MRVKRYTLVIDAVADGFMIEGVSVQIESRFDFAAKLKAASAFGEGLVSSRGTNVRVKGAKLFDEDNIIIKRYSA